MSKYTKEQLREMARLAVEAKRHDAIRYHQTLITMVIRTGLPAVECERRIQELAS